jgi:hypothetical protein
VEQLAQPQPGSSPLHFDRPYTAFSWQQFDVLMRRWLQSYWRNPLYNATRFAFCILLGVVLGTVYLWKGSKRWGAFRQRLGCLGLRGNICILSFCTAVT